MADPPPGTAVLTQSSRVQCAHGAIAMCPMPTQTWVKIEGDAILTESDSHAVAGCPNGNGQDPCLFVRWSGGSARLSIEGTPVLTASSAGKCYAKSGADAGAAKVDPWSLQTLVLDE